MLYIKRKRRNYAGQIKKAPLDCAFLIFGQSTFRRGGDGVTLFETRPLEDILADIAEGWDSTRRCMGRVRASAFTEVSYVL